MTAAEGSTTTQSPDSWSAWLAQPQVSGILCGALAAIGYTATNTALRAVALETDPIWVSTWKAVPAAAAAWAIIAWSHSQGRRAMPPADCWLPLLMTGLLMQFGGNVCFQWALSLGGLALTVPLTLGSILLCGAIQGRLFLSEQVTPKAALALALLLAAIGVLSLGAEQATASVVGLGQVSVWAVVGGVLGACLAGFSYATGGVVIRRLARGRVSLAGTLMVLNSVGVVALGLTAWGRSGTEALLATSSWEVGMMLLAGGFNALAFFAMARALQLIPVVQCNALQVTQAAMCAAAGVVIFGEDLTVWLLLGIVLTAVGLALLGDRRPHRAPRPDHDANGPQPANRHSAAAPQNSSVERPASEPEMVA